MRQIAELGKQKGGLIEVAVGNSSIDDPVKDVSVTATARGHSYSGKTNNKGRAEIHVPPGWYALMVGTDKQYGVDWLSYELSNNIEIQNGSCAQVQFTSAGDNH